MNFKNLSIKRINNDIKEIYKNPIEGIGIISLENDIKKYIVNIKLLSGPYKDYCLQLLLTFPDNYPINPPKILIYPSQLFDNLYHRHVFNDTIKDENGACFKKICFDLLDNDFLSTKTENSGWNPSYTISTLLIQVQIFLSNPDLSENSMPKPYQIKELMESMNNYKRNFIIKENNKESIKVHTWKDPYPKIYLKLKEKLNNDNDKISNDKNLLIIKENLTCFILKSNFIDDKTIILGYPIVKKENSGIIYPIPEIISYEGYLTQIINETSDYDKKPLKSANNKYYNNWLPIYINKLNFEKNKQTILNSFSVIKYGFSGEEKFDFKKEYIYEIMLKLFNQMITNIKDKKFSASYLRAFFQYILLYKKLSETYPIDINNINMINVIKNNDIISNINDLIIYALFEKINLLEKHLYDLNEKLKNELAFKLFLEKKDCILKAPNEFYEYLNKNNLFNGILEVMRFERNLFLFNGKYINKKIKNIIINSFKEFILNSDIDTKENIEKFILKNLKFYNYINLDKFFLINFDNETEKKMKKIFSKLGLIIYLNKIINENIFINQLENNFGVYLEIDEIIEKINEIINNNDIYYSKEIDNIYSNIKIILKELFILDKNIKKIINENKDNKDNKICLDNNRNIFNDNYSIRYIDISTINIGISKNEKISDIFDKIEKMDLNNLKMLYLYCSERLYKKAYPKRNNLSLIESIFIINSLNSKKKRSEWINYIYERQIYENEHKVKLNKKNSSIIEPKKVISLFNFAKSLNESLTSKNGGITFYNFDLLDIYYCNLFTKILSIIIQFFEIVSGERVNFKDIFGIDLPVLYQIIFISYIKEESLIQKLREVYYAGDITLLTFIEFIWIEAQDYDLFNGFLSSLETNISYDLRMKEHIKTLKDANKPREKGKIKKMKRINNDLNKKNYFLFRGKKLKCKNYINYQKNKKKKGH